VYTDEYDLSGTPIVSSWDLLELIRPEWHARANCRGHLDVMFPEVGDSAQPARNYCSACTVVTECREQIANLDNTTSGIWGGLTTTARIKARRAGIPLTALPLPTYKQPPRPSRTAAERTNTPRLPTALCGTESGYRAHHRLSTTPCAACKAAKAAANAQRRRQREEARCEVVDVDLAEPNTETVWIDDMVPDMTAEERMMST
jgi:hypothetical protein